MANSSSKEPEIIYKYKREEWYGVPSKYWLGGGLLVTVLICAYLAMKLYGNKAPNNNQQSHREQHTEEQTEGLPLYPNAPPMPSGGIPYSPSHNRPVNLGSSPVSTNSENMTKRDLINNVPVFSSHLAQFESQYQPLQQREHSIRVQEAVPESMPQQRQQQQQSQLQEPRQEQVYQRSRPVSSDSSSQVQPETPRQDSPLPSNKEGGGEGIPLPPIDYSAFQEDAF